MAANLVPSAQNPMLVPQLGQGTTNGNVTFVQSPAQVLAANPRVAASCAGTLSTNPSNGDILTLTVSNNVFPGGAIVINYTASSDTVITVAAHLASALTSNSVAQAFQVFGTSAGTDVFTVNELGPVGNFTALSFSSTGSTTCSFAASGVMSGGSGPVIPSLNFNFAEGPVSLRFLAGQPSQLPANFVSDLVHAGMPVI